MKKIIICAAIVLLFTGCKKQPLFFTAAPVMITWSAVDTTVGGVQVALSGKFDDSLQRYYYTLYSAITNFKTKEFHYHVSSVNFHKDSVDINKLHRLEKYNSNEKWMIKRKRNGKHMITSEWTDNEKRSVKIKTEDIKSYWQPKNEKHMALISGFMQNGKASCNNMGIIPAKNIIEHTYWYNGLSSEKRYFEYRFEFDSISYVFMGDRYLPEYNRFQLYRINNCKPYMRQVHGIKIDFKPAPDSLKFNPVYPLIVTISLPNGDTLKSELPTVNQELRAGKWGAWVGFSTCTISEKIPGDSPARNRKTGSLKMLIL